MTHNEHECPPKIVEILSEMAMYRRQRLDTAQAFLGGVDGVYAEVARLKAENDAAKNYLMMLVFKDAERRGLERAVENDNRSKTPVR